MSLPGEIQIFISFHSAHPLPAKQHDITKQQL